MSVLHSESSLTIGAEDKESGERWKGQVSPSPPLPAPPCLGRTAFAGLAAAAVLISAPARAVLLAVRGGDQPQDGELQEVFGAPLRPRLHLRPLPHAARTACSGLVSTPDAPRCWRVDPVPPPHAGVREDAGVFSQPRQREVTSPSSNVALGCPCRCHDNCREYVCTNKASRAGKHFVFSLARTQSDADPAHATQCVHRLAHVLGPGAAQKPQGRQRAGSECRQED